MSLRAAGAAAGAIPANISISQFATPAGRIVQYVKDYSGLAFIVSIVIVAWWFYTVGFPRFSWFYHEENIDSFLSENNFLEDNLKGLLTFVVPRGFDKFEVSLETLSKDISNLKANIEANFPNNYQKAIIHYYAFYDLIKHPDPASIPYPPPNGFSTDYNKFYKFYATYLSLSGEVDMSGMGNDQKAYEVYKLDNPEGAGKNPYKLKEKIRKLGEGFEALAKSLNQLIRDLSSKDYLAYIIIPDDETLTKVKRDLEKYKANINDVYTQDFKYTNVNEFSWYFFECLQKDNPQMPNYDSNLTYILTNYVNSDYKTRQKARNLLIKNNTLCDFLDRHPLFAKVQFATQFNDKKAAYSKLKSIYASAIVNLDDFMKEINNIKLFINYCHITNLYLSTYCKEHKGYNRYHIMRIYNDRYTGRGWDFFVGMMKPYFQDIIIDRILAHLLRIFTAEYWKERLAHFMTLWGRVGNSIMNIPANVMSDIKSRRNMKKEPFEEIKVNQYEGFLGAIFGPIIAVGKFFMSMLKIALTIADLFMAFTKDPFGVLKDAFTLIFATLISIILVILYVIISLPIFIIIPFGLYFFFTDIVLWLINAFYRIWMFLFIVLFVAILTVINVATKGGVQKLMLCENSPGAWYKHANYHLRNIYERSTFCSVPCPTGYAPSTSGRWCSPTPDQHPSFCPEAEIMRIYSGYKRTDIKYSYPDYKTFGNVKYETSTPLEKENKLFKHFRIGKRFFEKCNKPMENFTDVSKSICSNLDAIEKSKPHGLTDADVIRLRRLCRQSFCNSRSAYGFCNKPQSFTEDDPSALIKNICMIVFSIIMFTILVIIIVYVTFEDGGAIMSFKLPDIHQVCSK